MLHSRHMHEIVIVAFDGVVPFDLATPCEVFGRARLADGSPAYRVRVCGTGGELDAGAFRLRPRWGLRALAGADTVIVPGLHDLARPPAPALLRDTDRAAQRLEREVDLEADVELERDVGRGVEGRGHETASGVARRCGRISPSSNTAAPAACTMSHA